MRIGTRLTSVAVACSLVSLAVYSGWSLTLRRAQLLQELQYEEQSLATVLEGALEAALEHRSIEEARDVVEQLSSAERVFGLAVHARQGEAVAMSASLRELSGRVPRNAVDRALQDGMERQLRLTADGRKFLVHILPIKGQGEHVDGVAEVWRDLGYIDQYLQETALRLALLAVGLGGLLTAALVTLTRRSITRPADALIHAMEQVASGDLSIRVAAGRAPPEGELGDIARAFDSLAHSLGQAKEELEASAADRAALASRLRQSERLATLGQIVAEVAHEIGTPLNVVSGRAEDTVQLVEAAEGGDAHAALLAAHANAQTIQAQARRITRIMQRLLDVARERMPEVGAVRVAGVVRRVGEFLAPDFASARVRLVHSGDESLRARADEDSLQQVLINLLVNALQASPAGGCVRVAVSDGGGQVVIDVEDDGPGVDPAILPRLWDPFATTKTPGKGTGLGLSISKSIVRQLGGSLRYLPQEGKPGARFQISLLSAAAPETGFAAAGEVR